MAEPLSPRRRLLVRLALVLLAALGLVAGLFVLTYVPPTAASFYPKCVSYQLTGIHCPGCGLTRAAHSLLNGQIEQAFAYNPLLVLLAPYLLVAFIRWLWFWLWGTEAQRSLFPARYAWVFGVVFVLYWIFRNIPVYPFTLLAPHEITP